MSIVRRQPKEGPQRLDIRWLGEIRNSISLPRVSRMSVGRNVVASQVILTDVGEETLTGMQSQIGFRQDVEHFLKVLRWYSNVSPITTVSSRYTMQHSPTNPARTVSISC